MKLLDETLITSEVCIRCGSCCKMTTAPLRTNANGVEWYKVIVQQTDRIKLVNIDPENETTKIRFVCPKLVIDNDAGTKMCSIYESRPTVCRNYNCFDQANKRKRRPEQFQFIADIIKQVHGIEVKWNGPLYGPGGVVKQS